MQVKKRTANANDFINGGSHVMEYGNRSIRAEKLYLYQGFDPATVNFPPNNNKLDMPMGVVNQRDAELFFMWQLVRAFLHLFLNPYLGLVTYFQFFVTLVSGYSTKNQNQKRKKKS